MKITMTMIFAMLTLVSAMLRGQTDPNLQWVSYMNSENIQAVAEDAASLWLGTTAGFVQYDKSTGATHIYSKTNSPLPHNTVYCVAVDQQANKWVGTWAGAAKFTGSAWEVFTTANSPLPSNVVWGIAVDKNNAVWCATQQGIARYSGGTWTVFNKALTPELTIDNFRCVTVDANGIVWAGTTTSFYQQGGLFKYDGVKWTAYTMQNSALPDYYINGIAAGKNNEVWIASDNKGLVKFDGTSFTVFDQQTSTIPDIRVRGVAVDKNNAVWLATESYLKKGGVAKFDGTKFTNYTFDAGTYQSPTALCIFPASDGKVYSGAQYKGLSVFNGSAWTLKKVSACGLPSNSVNCVLVDAKNTKWFGTDDAGLAKFDGSTWTVYDTTTTIKLPHMAVLSLAEDRDGAVWVGTKKGIVKITGAASIQYNSESATPVNADWVQAVRVDKNNVKWFACSSGLVKYDGAAWSYYGPQNIPVMPSFLSNFTSLCIDKNSNVWAGVLGFGVVKFDGTSWTAYSTTNSGLTFADVEKIEQDNTGTIWIGTYGQSPDGNNGGMFTYTGSVWKNLRQNNSLLPGNYINALTKSPSGEMWIGATSYGATFGGGLAVYDGVSQWSILTPENSKLPYAWISDIQFDKAGNAWMGIYGYGAAVYKKSGIDHVGGAEAGAVPEEFGLEQNFPNPFNPTTVLQYSIAAPGLVQLTICDMLGRNVATLVNDVKAPGAYSAEWNAGDLPSGIYFSRLRAGTTTSVRKLVLQK